MYESQGLSVPLPLGSSSPRRTWTAWPWRWRNVGSTRPATQHHNPEDLSLQSGIYFCLLVNYYANV